MTTYRVRVEFTVETSDNSEGAARNRARELVSKEGQFMARGGVQTEVTAVNVDGKWYQGTVLPA